MPDKDYGIYSEEDEKQTDIVKCPSCGSNLEFDPKTQSLKCPHCGYEETIEKETSSEIVFDALAKTDGSWNNETHIFRCQNCGANVVIEKKEISTNCPFCGTSNVVLTEELSGQKPNAVVPFKLNKNEASDFTKRWLKRKFFAPKKFKQSAEPEGMNGVYNPTFTFDADTTSTYRGTLGKYHTVTVSVNGKPVQRREIRYFSIAGTYNCFYDEVMIQASPSFTQKTLTALRPFDSNNSVKYQPKFLFGFAASQYTKDGNECWKEAKSRIEEKIRKGILAQYHYDVVKSLSIAPTYLSITHKYLLLPIYVGHFNWSQKLYNFYVNGFNGKVTGKVPVSVWKVLLVVGIAVAVLLVFLLIYLLSQ